MTRRIHGLVIPREPARRRAWLGGFNLLPYRFRDVRRQRLQIGWEAVAAVLIGLLGVIGWSVAQTRERAGIDARWEQIEHRLALLAPQLDEARHLTEMLDGVRQRRAQAVQLVGPRTYTVNVLRMLGELKYEGAVLARIDQTEAETIVEVMATNHDAAAAWLRQMDARATAWSIDVAGVRSGLAHARDFNKDTLMFSFRIRRADVITRTESTVSTLPGRGREEA